MGQGNCSGFDICSTGRHVGALTSAKKTLVLIWEDLKYCMDGEGGGVPDGLYPGYGPPSLQELVCPVPKHNSDHYMILE